MSDTAMTCRQLVELVTEYLEGTLSSSDLAGVVEHLKTCPGCASHVEQMRQTVRILGLLPKTSLPEGTRQELLRMFRGWKQDPRSVDMFQLGTPGQEVIPGSHMVNYYRTDQQRDDFALRYLSAGLQAGENCVILGDPVFVDYAGRLLQAAEPPPGWPGRLFLAPWDRVPSPEAAQEFVALHAKINDYGPAEFLAEVPLRKKGPAASPRRLRGLGNFRHWSRTESGSRDTIQICASVDQLYRGGTGIVVCQWEVPGRSAAFRWGALAVHTHMVNGTCIPCPSEALERYVQGAAAGVEELLGTVQGTWTRGEAAEVPRMARKTESALADIQHFLASIGG
jgi:Putative zinc-finger